MEIVEIIRPSDQGRTKPYLCRGDDEVLYYVKGQNAGPRAQCSEWIVGSLARNFGLPVPPFLPAYISPALLAETRQEWRGLGSGIAFASRMQIGVQWFEPGYAHAVNRELRRDVLAFDWWVKNFDRQQDNSNLLWHEATRQLSVIDFDLAFSTDFWPSLFQRYHVFNEDWDSIFGDIASQAEYSSRFIETLSIWDTVCQDMPEPWYPQRLSGGNAEVFDLKAARSILDRCLTNELWGMT